MENLSPNELVRRGVVQVMEGRHCFEHLTVEENLLTGAYTRKDGGKAVRDDLEMVYNYFPRLRERRKSQAGYTSGGEQQMVAVGRALMSRPKLILLDEPSMGLALTAGGRNFRDCADPEPQGRRHLSCWRSRMLRVALRYATYGYILENGRVVMDGEARALSQNEDVKEFYLGISGGDKKSFRDVKHYRRRKRWLA
ncbi:MAG: ATP-binding cassette domain-containing protein [Thiolinea sp.]